MPIDALINLTYAAMAGAAIVVIITGCAVAVHHQNHPRGHR